MNQTPPEDRDRDRPIRPLHDPDVAKQIPDPGFSGDDGSADSRVTEALAAFDDTLPAYVEALAALRNSRLLVPVVALLGEVEYDERGLAHEKSSDMAAVLMTAPDGRQALLAFTSTETLARWNPQARPVPVTAQTAAQSAIQDNAAALLIDVAGPHTFVIEGESLRGVAAGWILTRVGDDYGWLAEAPPA